MEQILESSSDITTNDVRIRNKNDLIIAYMSGSSGTTVDWPQTAKNIINDIEK